MARPKKVIEEPIEQSEVKEEQQEDVIVETEVYKEEVPVLEQKGIVEPRYIPDIPAQMIEEEKESDEILFLRRVLKIQDDGGFGRHLNEIINERIKALKNGD